MTSSISDESIAWRDSYNFVKDTVGVNNEKEFNRLNQTLKDNYEKMDKKIEKIEAKLS
jgi:hypothetical protein